MADKKRYIVTSVTLGVIAASSALLIGLTNLVTRNQIAQNEKNKINAGIVEIFGKTATISTEFGIKDSNLTNEYKYVQHIYSVSDGVEKQLGYAFKTTGSNMYGKISLLVGFDETSHGFIGLSLTVNEQTYASTLVENYVIPLNDGSGKIDDVSCGATYGAKLVRDMVNEAEQAAKELWKE